MIRKEYSPEPSSDDEAAPSDESAYEPSAPSIDDESFRRFVASGDGTAFEALVRRHERLVMGVCVRILGQRQAAEDAFQETFFALAKRAGSIRDPGALPGWLHRVASNEALRIRLQAQRRAAREAAVERGTVVPAPAHEERQLHAIIDEAIGDLPDKYRLPLVLRYVEGVSTDTAARRLGHPKGSMSTLIARGLELLRSGLHEKGVAVSGGLLLSALASLAAQGQAAAPAVIATVVRSAAPVAGVAIASNLKTIVAAFVVAAGTVGTGLLLTLPPTPDLPPVVAPFESLVRDVAPPPRPAEFRPAALPPPPVPAPAVAPPAPEKSEKVAEKAEAKAEKGEEKAAEKAEKAEEKAAEKLEKAEEKAAAAGPPEALPELPDLPETASEKAVAALRRALERRQERGPAPAAQKGPDTTGLDRAREASRGAMNAAERAQQAAQQIRGRSGK